jgi:hypothetical protein
MSKMSDTVSEVSKVRELREPDNLDPATGDLNDAIELSGVLELQLENGNTFLVEKTDPKASMWKEFVDWQQKKQLPVYVEVQTQSRIVREIFPTSKRLPDHVNRQPVDGRLRVIFRASPAIFYLNPALPKFKEMWARLDRAAADNDEVLVTHHPLTLEMIDVRDAPEEETPEETLEPPPPPGAPAIHAAPALVKTEVTLEEAIVIFNAMAVADIPFFFIRDCCTARAQKMCRLMLEDFKVRALKIWNYGNGFASDKRTLCVKTSVDPSGKVCWTYHVAPILNVVDGTTKTLVIDPSMFDGPVAISTWLLAQNDSDSKQEFTDANNFENKPNSPADLFDPGPAKVDEKLNDHTGQSILTRNLTSLVFKPPA